ncbi:hypothetical protein A7982_13444 [Minicystis rosea]|nr:hypothetical protein A7982_13444 [Minicystis rosea]
MGLEATCTIEWQGRSFTGKALLESTELIVRGEHRLKIARDRITAVTVSGGALRVTVGTDTAIFALGDASERWARALQTTKSRLDKLGVKPGLVTSVVGVEDASFHDELRARIGTFAEGTPAEGGDLLFFGLQSRADLHRIDALEATLAPTGALWLIRPKGHAEITEAVVRAEAHRAGLVDVKVASFSATHTAEKFVIPVAARGAAPTKQAPAKAASSIRRTTIAKRG